jgi:hypothetical protein
MTRKFGPRTAETVARDPGGTCLACKKTFKVGDYTALVVIGPGDDEEQRAKCKARQPYNAVAVEIHFDCAGWSADD